MRWTLIPCFVLAACGEAVDSTPSSDIQSASGSNVTYGDCDVPDPEPDPDPAPNPSPDPPPGGFRIMAIGDSITQGSGGSMTYRNALMQRLRSRGIASSFVGSNQDYYLPAPYDFHNGHGGWCTTTFESSNQNGSACLSTSGQNAVLPHLSQWLDEAPPNIVLLMIGTNDQWYSDAISPSTSHQAVASRIVQMIDVIHAHDASTVVFVGGLHFAWDHMEAFNATLAAAIAGKATYVDAFAGYDDGVDLTNDAVHPTQAGFDKMGSNWFEAMRARMGW